MIKSFLLTPPDEKESLFSKKGQPHVSCSVCFSFSFPIQPTTYKSKCKGNLSIQTGNQQEQERERDNVVGNGFIKTPSHPSKPTNGVDDDDDDDGPVGVLMPPISRPFHHLRPGIRPLQMPLRGPPRRRHVPRPLPHRPRFPTQPQDLSPGQ